MPIVIGAGVSIGSGIGVGDGLVQQYNSPVLASVPLNKTVTEYYPNFV